MFAEDLMIGTIVEKQWKFGWSWIEVSHEDIYSIKCGNRKHYRPIKVSKEWLLKLGFTQLNESDFYKTSSDIEIELSGDTLYVYYRSAFIKEVLFVHELWNIFYLIDGITLEVKK